MGPTTQRGWNRAILKATIRRKVSLAFDGLPNIKDKTKEGIQKDQGCKRDTKVYCKIQMWKSVYIMNIKKMIIMQLIFIGW